MDFPTMYSKVTSDFVSPCGEPTLQEYEYSFDKEGKKQLVMKNSKINVYDRIQADRESTDINILMQRFALGDSEALNINKGFFIDARELPKNYAEVFARGLEAEVYFEGLPVELKEMFDNSYSVFFTEMGSPSFDEKVAKYNDRFVNHQFEDSDIKSDPVNTQPREVEYHE